MDCLRNSALLLVAISVQIFVAHASPLGLLGNSNNDGSLLSALNSATLQINASLLDANLAGNLSSLPTALDLENPNLTNSSDRHPSLSNTVDGLECRNLPNLGPNVYTCEDHVNSAVVVVERQVPGDSMSQSQFNTSLYDVIHDIDSLISSSGSSGKKTPRVIYEKTSGSLYFRSSQYPAASGQLNLGHILAAARTIKAENGRLGGPVTVGFVIYGAGPAGGFVKVGVGAVYKLS